MALILAGFCGAGKSTLGALCAEKLSLPFYDTDEMLKSQFHGKTTPEIWHKLGSETFRLYESQIVLSLEKKPSIIALGGGVLVNEKSKEYLQNLGTLVYLKASVSFLYERLLKRGFPAFFDTNRPLAQCEEIAQIRFPIYEAACHYKIEIENQDQEDLIEELMRIYGRK